MNLQKENDNNDIKENKDEITLKNNDVNVNVNDFDEKDDNDNFEDKSKIVNKNSNDDKSRVFRHRKSNLRNSCIKPRNFKEFKDISDDNSNRNLVKEDNIDIFDIDNKENNNFKDKDNISSENIEENNKNEQNIIQDLEDDNNKNEKLI